jgi:sterol desaturase/sphingolipid hydroxylase (fatty acid hydroxylase superfamily)
MESWFDTVLNQLGGPNGLWWLAGAYFGMALGERVYYAIARRGEYDDADALCSIGLNLLGSVLTLLFTIAVPLALYLLVFDNFRFFTLNSLVVAIPLAFVVHELAYYTEHRLSHRVGLLWAFHSIHHSSNEFNHTTAARGFVLDGKLQGVFGLTAAIIGVPPLVYFAVVAAKAMYGIWNHASYVGHLGWLEAVFATPRNHMVHHANQPQYIDKNYSQVLIVWDRLLGTFAKYEEPPVVGLVKPVTDNNPLTAQFAGFVQLWDRMKTAPRWQDRAAYLWMPPEWSHDGVCRSECPKYAVPAE